MFYLDHHVSTQSCRLRDVVMRVFTHEKTGVCTLVDLRKRVYV